MVSVRVGFHTIKLINCRWLVEITRGNIMETQIQEMLVMVIDRLEQLVENTNAIAHAVVGEQIPVPAFVATAQQILEHSNKVFQAAVAAETDRMPENEDSGDDEIQLGSLVSYVGERETYVGKVGTVVEVKERGWYVVAFNGLDKPASVRTPEITLGNFEQPPVEEQVEEQVEETIPEPVVATVVKTTSTTEITLDKEAADYQIPNGIYNKFSNIHAIYKAGDKERNYLRFRAKRELNDKTTQMMCHRYLVSVQDEAYMQEVPA